MEITLTLRAEELLRRALARHPDHSAAEILEKALAERVERKELLAGLPMHGEAFSRHMIYQDYD